MGRNNRSDPFPLTPTLLEQHEFSRHGLVGPSLGDFRIVVDGHNPACSWNQQAARVAAQGYVSKPEALTKDQGFVREVILSHFRSLREEYRRQCRE